MLLLVSLSGKTDLLRWLRKRRMYDHAVSAWIRSPILEERDGKETQVRTIEKMMDAAAFKAGSWT